ncbi:hypothetical protein JCM9279_001060 [Rhodotorula babjevae]
MGLFSRKKQREPPPRSSPPPHPHPPPGPRASTSAPATTTLATSSTYLSSSQPSSYGRSSTSYDDRPLAADAAAYSPELASSSTSRVFRGHAARAASSSTLSLPSFGNGRDPGAAPRQRQASATATIMSSVDEHEPPAGAAQGGSKWASKWKFGRGSKGRQGSTSSAAGGDGFGLGIVDGDGDGDSGFVVRSFRTVSRVQEDRAPSSSTSSAQPQQPPPVPPLSYYPKPAAAAAAAQTPQQPDLVPEPQESLRTSIDFNNPSNQSRPPSSFHYPRRPSLATLGGANPSSSSAWERAPSPTMTAEAFRSRSRSTLSLASATDLALAPSDPSSSDPTAPRERPRFEPQQRPASASRRGSTYSELGASTGSQSILAPPRPSFVGMHSNSSSSSIGSRASSSASLGRQGRDGLPSSASGASTGAGASAGAAASAPSSPGAGTRRASQVEEARRPSMGYERPSMSTSTSLFSMASYSTAQQQPTSQPQSRSGTSTPARPSTRHASPATSPTTSTAPSALTHEHERRPAPPQRMSTDDSELRLIAAYGDMLNASPPVASPLELEPEPERHLPYATPRKVSDGPRSSTAPAVAVQPPTPQSAPGFASSSSPAAARRASALVPRPQRSSSLFNESAQAALAAMGVGAAPSPAPAPAPAPARAPAAAAAAAAARAQRVKGKNAVYPSRGGAGGWASDSSEGDEDGERLSSESDEEDDGASGSSSDDEVPLAQIRSRSQVDLSLPPAASALASARGSVDGGARAPPPSRPGRDARDVYRRPSSELEVLRDQHSPPIAGSFGGARDKAHHQAQQQQQQAQLGMGAPLARRGSNRRSLSTLSFSTSMTASQQATAVAAASASAGVPGAVATAPPSPARSAAAATRGILRPAYGARSVSNPASPTVQALQSSASSSSIDVPPVPALQGPALPPVASPLFASVAARDRSSASASASSGSGSASTSSVPITPKDSPSASHLGFPPSSLHLQQQQLGDPTSVSALGRPSVKFDPVASQTDAAGWNRGRRLSAITSSAASAMGAALPPSQQQQQQQPSLAHRATPSMPHLGAGYAASSARGHPQQQQQQHLNPRSSALPSARSSMSAAATAAPHTRASSTASASNGPSTASSSITAVDDGVYDRMKARHKAEALDALRIGRDLNHPSGRVPERAAVGGGESSDEDEPLANLPTKGSVLGGAGGSVMGMGGGGAGSMMAGMHPQMAMGMGGAFSPLAVAPPGVDPYLYASLPLDQKMSLHQRAAQMMQMMHQASLQARAESVVAGSMLGGHDGSPSNQSFRGGGVGHGSSMSLGSFDQFSPQGGAGYGQGHGGHHQHSSSMQLPPFAPSFAMSQPFFHTAQYSQAPSLYGMPAYAGSALGFSTGPPMSAYGGAPQSVMGHPASTGQLRSSGGRSGARAASTMGTGPRRP